MTRQGSLRTLFRQVEFDRLLERLAAFAASEAGRAACLDIVPAEDAGAVDALAQRFGEARTFFVRTGFSPGGFPDLGPLLANGLAASPDLDDFYAVKAALVPAKRLKEALSDGKATPEASAWPTLYLDSAKTPWPAKTAAGLDRALADEGGVRDEASPELFHARTEIRRIHRICTRKFKDFIVEHKLGHYLQDEFLSLYADRYVMPLKANFKGRHPGINHGWSNTGETIWFEPLFLVELNNELQDLKGEERAAEKRVLAELTVTIRREIEALAATFGLLVAFDVAFAKHRFAEAVDGSIPAMQDEAPIRLKDARHPLLCFDAAKPKPQTIELHPEHRALVVSGGNAGGKTVALKTAALAALCARSGVPFPAGEDSTLPRIERIFAFLGDEQSLSDHLSTFTAQIDHLARIWDSVDAHTLVVLDEFGAGTDPAEGSALAVSVIEALVERGAYVVAATHFPDVKAWSLSAPGVRAATVLFHPETQRPLFTLGYDQIGASRALMVAEAAGLPQVVLDKARRRFAQGPDSGRLIERLNELAAEKAAEVEAARVERQNAKREQAKLADALKRERERVRSEIDKMLAALNEQLRGERIDKKEAVKELKRLREETRESEREALREKAKARLFDPAALALGSTATYLPWMKLGRVVEVDEKRGAVKLDLGSAALWAKLSEIETPQSKAGAGKPGGKTGTVIVNVDLAHVREVDVRGTRADEATSMIETALDQALLAGVDELRVVHGRGTGALRRATHEFLRTHPSVKRFALCSEEEGGDGATVVALT